MGGTSIILTKERSFYNDLSRIPVKKSKNQL